jgi:hypothetical protein
MTRQAISQRRKDALDIVGEAALGKGERGKVLVFLTQRRDHRRTGTRPADADDLDIARAIGEQRQQALHRHAVLAVEAPLAAERGIGIVGVEYEESILGHRHHILNTPNCGFSGIGASRQAASASPSTSRVCAGSITPSSQRRAVA